MQTTKTRTKTAARFGLMLLLALALTLCLGSTAHADGITTWTQLQTALRTSGTVTLTQDITGGEYSTTLSVMDGVTVTLDLNGHTIDRGTGSGSVITVMENGALTLTDTSNGVPGTITGGAGGEYGAGGVLVNSGSFTMEGGTISGNTGAFGGVLVNGGSFTMSGGAITGNSNVGVFVNTGDGSFTMTGGTITNNTGTYGGVYFNYGSFSISGAPMITGNTGGNVHLSSDQKISVTGALTNEARIGVTTGTNPTAGQPVVFTSGLSGRGTAANFTSDNAGFETILNAYGEAMLAVPLTVGVADGITNGTVTYKVFEGAATADDSTVYCNDIITVIPAPATGCEIESVSYLGVGDNAPTAIAKDADTGEYWFAMPGQDVTVTATFITEWADLQRQIDAAAGTVTLTKNYTATAGDTALVIPVNKTVTLDLNGFTIDRHLSEATNFGVVIRVNGNLTVRDSSDAGTGTITGGFNATDTGAGGVAVTDSGSFTLESGKITGNKAAGAPGAGGVIVWESAVFTMTGGEISGNEGSGDSAGGVGSAGTVKLSGSPVITDNVRVDGESRNPANLCLVPEAFVTVTGALTNGTPIGITTATAPTASSPVVITSGLSSNGAAANFTSDDGNYLVSLLNGEAALFTKQFGEPDFVLPAGIVTIEESAFEGAVMRIVYIPDTCASLGANAFKDCAGLTQIRLPKDCAIGDGALSGCTSLIAVYAPAGGTTQSWCTDNNILFIAE